MSELMQLQDAFQDYLFQSSDAIQESIVNSEKVSIDVRLAIYQNAYYSRLIEALESTYPILHHYLEEEAFQNLGYRYIHQYHSSYRSIRWFGDELSVFLNKHSEYEMLPYLSELAKFEWTLSLVFDAADAPVISIEEIGKISPDLWENMRFKTHSSMHFIELKWNVVAVWEALSENKNPVVWEEGEIPVCWIAWRKDLITQFCSLPPDEAWAIQAMVSGKTFGEICEGLCQWQNEDDAPMHAASLLKGWITAGLISCISTEIS